MMNAAVLAACKAVNKKSNGHKQHAICQSYNGTIPRLIHGNDDARCVYRLTQIKIECGKTCQKSCKQ